MTATKDFTDKLARYDKLLGVKFDPQERGGRWMLYRKKMPAHHFKTKDAWRGVTARQQRARRNWIWDGGKDGMCMFMAWVENADKSFRPLDDRVFALLDAWDTYKHNVLDEALRAKALDDEAAVKAESDRMSDIADRGFAKFQAYYDQKFGQRNTPRASSSIFTPGPGVVPGFKATASGLLVPGMA